MNHTENHKPTIILRGRADWDDWMLYIQARLAAIGKGGSLLKCLSAWQRYDIPGSLQTKDPRTPWPYSVTPVFQKTAARTYYPGPLSSEPDNDNPDDTQFIQPDEPEEAPRRSVRLDIPADPTSDAESNQRIQAYGIILDTIDKSLYPAIRPAQATMDPRHLLKLLHEHFYRNTGFTSIALFTELQQIKLADYADLSALTDRIETISQELSAQGMPIPDAIKLTYLLNALGPAYESIVTDTNTAQAAGRKVTYDSVKGRALAYETGLACNKPKPGKGGSQAFMAADPAAKPKCDRCLRPGHTASACLAPRPANANLPSKGCFECGSLKHQKRQCPRLQRNKQQGGRQDPKAVTFAGSTLIVDTAAEQHIVNDASLLANVSPTQQ